MLHIIDVRPQKNRYPDTVLLMPGHVGSSSKDDFRHKVHLMAQYLSMRIIAWDRPGNATNARLAPSRALTAEAYLALMGQVCDELDRILAARHIKRVVVSGNSAAGPDAIFIALGVKHVTHAALADPAAIEDVSFVRAAKRYLSHRRIETIRPVEKRNPEPGPKISQRLMLRRFFHDIRIYRRVWRSSIALEGLRELAARPDIATTVEFVERTFAASPRKMQELATELTTTRANLAKTAPAAPFHAYVAKDEYHSRYDSARIHADLIQETLEKSR